MGWGGVGWGGVGWGGVGWGGVGWGGVGCAVLCCAVLCCAPTSLQAVELLAAFVVDCRSALSNHLIACLLYKQQGCMANNCQSVLVCLPC